MTVHHTLLRAVIPLWLLSLTVTSAERVVIVLLAASTQAFRYLLNARMHVLWLQLKPYMG